MSSNEKHLRLMESLGLYLLVAGSAIVVSLGLLFTNYKTNVSFPADLFNQRYIIKLVADCAAIMMALTLLIRRGKLQSPKGILAFKAVDLLTGAGLALLVYALHYAFSYATMSLQIHVFHGPTAALHAKNVGFVTAGSGIIFWILRSLVACTNPVMEELILRGVVQTDMEEITGSAFAAGAISVVMQGLYHLYQGIVPALGTMISFSIYAIYFRKRGRLVPVIFAHLLIDLIALVIVPTLQGK